MATRNITVDPTNRTNNRFRVLMLFSLLAQVMHPGFCNKCKTGKCCDGDAWCLGCSSLEAAQGLLRKRWTHPGLRGVAEESTLNCARYVRALFNLDSTLGSSAAGSQPLLTAAKSKAEKRRSRSPRDNRPPIRRALPPREADPEDRVDRRGSWSHWHPCYSRYNYCANTIIPPNIEDTPMTQSTKRPPGDPPIPPATKARPSRQMPPSSSTQFQPSNHLGGDTQPSVTPNATTQPAVVAPSTSKTEETEERCCA